MGRIANVYQSAPHDDSGSYDGGDSKVKMTRQVTGALRRPQCGIKAQRILELRRKQIRLRRGKEPAEAPC
jgi:hypothetical protein